ncbi:hypothetical protein [Pseudomonas baetica]|uniref:hypothetical protein n=1 Tax=Pseudomonas baetica TaxID=674054 RepID=UPI000BA421C3|nr:hypothetical protein [Pseudomonas baetica]MDR9865229.1 hypothetical protein [Pseudomonas baetica]
MSYKCWRFLIVEENSIVQTRIAKTLTQLGCRDLTPVGSFRELLALTHYSHDPFLYFDLMIINGELLATMGVDPVRFFQSNKQIRQGVIHDLRRGQPQPETIYANARRQLSLIRTPDRQTLGALLEQLVV